MHSRRDGHRPVSQNMKKQNTFMEVLHFSMETVRLTPSSRFLRSLARPQRCSARIEQLISRDIIKFLGIKI